MGMRGRWLLLWLTIDGVVHQCPRARRLTVHSIIIVIVIYCMNDISNSYSIIQLSATETRVDTRLYSSSIHTKLRESLHD